MLKKRKIYFDSQLKDHAFKLFEKFSFKYWCKKKISNNQLSHFESEELWEKIQNSLQTFN
jgi:hypothetical protein